MAIAFDSAGTAINTNGTISIKHTVVSNTNGILLAVFSDPTQSGTIVASPKFAGQNLTRIAGTSPGPSIEMWYLKNPPAGLGTLSGTSSRGAGEDMGGVSMAYTGVDQTTPIVGSVVSPTSIATSGSITRALGANNWFAGGIVIDQTPGTVNIGNSRGTATDTVNGYETIGADATGGTLRWTFPSADLIMVGAEIAAVGGGG